MAKKNGTAPIGTPFGGGKKEDSSSLDGEEPQKEMLQTSAQYEHAQGMVGSFNFRGQRQLKVNGSWLVEEDMGAPPDFLYYRMRLSLLGEACRENSDFAFKEYGKVDPDYYKCDQLEDRIKVNATEVKSELRNRIFELEKQSQRLERAGNDQKKAGLTGEEHQRIQRHRDFVTELKIENKGYAEEADKLDQAWKCPDSALIADREKFDRFLSEYVEQILLKAENMKGDMSKQMEIERFRDENVQLERIVSKEIDGLKQGDIQAFVGQTFEAHVYEVACNDLLERVGKTTDLIHKGMSIGEFFKQDLLKAQEVMIGYLNQAETAYNKSQNVGGDAKKAGLTPEEEKQAKTYKLYLHFKEQVDEKDKEGKLEVTPRHYLLYVIRLVEKQKEFLQGVITAFDFGSYSPDLMNKIQGKARQAKSYIDFVLPVTKENEQLKAQKAELQKQLAQSLADADRLQRAYTTLATAVKERVEADKNE